MKILGKDYLLQEFEKPGCFVKFVFNEYGVIFFHHSLEHRNMKQDSVSYEDNYQGNAMAGIVKKDCIEIRFHQAFSPIKVKSIIDQLQTDAQLQTVFQLPISYQGKTI